MAKTRWIRKQTGATPDLHKALKYIAWKEDKLLQDLFTEAIEEFLEHRKTALRKKQPLRYLANPGSAHDLNIRLPQRVGAEVDRVAEEDGTSARRVLYTALVFFAEQHGPPPQP